MSVSKDSEIKKASYWLSQVFVIIATIVGVFLAANQGYKLAVDFENNIAVKESYYLQKSLQYELEDNVLVVKNYINAIKSGDPTAKREALNLNTLVLENMKYSPITLSTPPEILRATQKFYRDVHEWYDKTSTSTVAVSFGSGKLQAAVDAIEKEIAGLKTNTEQLQKQVEKSGMTL